MNCKKCGSQSYVHSIRFFKNPAYKTIRDPLYALHIAKGCMGCGAFICFEKQTPELMEKLNKNALVDLNLEKIQKEREILKTT